MRKLLIILFLALISYPLTLQASIYGTLKGKIVDPEGKPAIGASVRIIGTARGTYVKNPDGSFTIVNIDAGTYTVKVTAVGFQDYEATNVKISADQTSEIEIQMSSKEVVTKAVVVTANRVMVNNTEMGRKRTMSSEEIATVAREGISNIIGLTPGVVATGEGYSIRGGNESETKVKIDGIDVTNQFTGQSAASAGPTEFDTEEIQVMTGGFSAEYGDAMSGIVNTVVKTGRTDRYEGYVRWRTDVDPLWGSQASGKELVYDQARNAYQSVESGEGAKYQGPGQHRFSFGTGGPIPLLSNSTFYIASNYTYREFNNPSYEIYDPIGNNLGQLPDQQSWEKNIETRLKFVITQGVDLRLGASIGSHSWENSSWNWLYANDQGAIWDWQKSDWQRDSKGNLIMNGIPERVAKQVVANNFNDKFFLRINHTLNSNSYYEFTVSSSAIREEYSKRKGWEDPSYFSGFEVWYPRDNKQVSGSILIDGTNNIVDNYEIIKGNSLTSDGYNNNVVTKRNPLTGYIEGAADASGTNNPYGRTQADFWQHGNSRNYEFRKSNILSADGNFTQVFEGEFRHLFRVGFDFIHFTISRHYNSLPWDGAPFFDVYTDDWKGNIYTLDPEAWAKTSKPFTPMKGSAYILDQIEYKGIIISPGLRFDMFLPNADYRTGTEKFSSITESEGFANSQIKYQLSPRINVAYPLTSRSNININYGLFFQMPSLMYMYDAFSTIKLRGNQTLGDPNMEAQRTNAYEASYNNQLTDELALTIGAYYKDIYNLLGQVYVPSVPQPYFQYSVSEYGNVKGLEFTLNKRPTYNDHIGLRFDYTLAQAIATSSNPGDNYNKPVDPYSELPAFPLSEFPTDLDIRHRITFINDFMWANNQGPAIGGIQPLENVNINFTTVWRSGSPYTKTDYNGIAIGEIRGERGPAYWQTDFRISKQFLLKDWLGDSWGKTLIEFSFFVNNIFNLNSATGLYTATGDADDQGLPFRRKVGDFGSEPFYKDADFTNTATLASTQYDNYGNRYYNSAADFDGNGIVNQQEKFDSYMKYLSTSIQFQRTFQAPRTVFFNILFSF